MKIKVKIFFNFSYSDLEKEINEFLKSRIDSVEIVDIKYCAAEVSERLVTRHSAMIIYKYQ
jgi:hypothetical protein